ncbi:MAG TPA: helix-turn-helix domain-containing protein, partial [Thermomonas sp.]|nr:helix-turn-helix domain-containing protein [Thermomonas sp.]
MSSRTAKTAADATPKPAGPGRPKDPGKRAAILDAAKRMFVAHGFDGVSMDQIASEAGVSKLTVYSHFGDKESLFAEAVRAHCEAG